MATLFWRPLAAGHAFTDSVWSTTDSGAAGTHVPPTSADTANFSSNDNNSCAISSAAVCNDINFTNGTGWTGTLTGSSTLTVSGSFTASSAMATPTYSGTATLNATATGKTFTAAKTWACNFTFSGAGGGWTLQDALNIGITNTVTVSNGTLVTGAFTHSWGIFSSTSGTRTLTFTNSVINITCTTLSTQVWGTSAAGLTSTFTGSTINFTGGGAGNIYTTAMAGQTYNILNFTAPGLWTINSTFSVKTFSYTSTTNKTDALSTSAGFTITAAGSLTIAGNSTVNRALFKAVTLGTQLSVSVPSGATVSLTNVDIQDIASAGTFGTWTGTSLGDCLGNSGITFDPSVSPSLTGTGTINWSTAAVWSTGKVPLPQDDVSLGSSSTATTLTADMPRLGRNIDSSGYLKTLSFASTPNTIFGNITLGASATYSGTQSLTLAGRGAQTITSNTKSFPQATFSIAAFGGSYTLQDAFNASTLQLNNGTFIDGGFAVAIPNFASASTGTQVLTMTGTWSLSQASATVWQARSGMTLTATGSTIKFTSTVSTNITFGGNGFTYGTLNWSSTASTGTLIITGANTFAALQSDYTTARTWQFPASTVTTVKPGGFQLSGKPGTQNITLNSSLAGTQATISMPWCGAQGGNVNYLTLKDINMTGGARWYVGAGSASTSNNTGMKFKQAGTGRYGSRAIAA